VVTVSAAPVRLVVFAAGRATEAEALIRESGG
jgi:hypothetical protein